MGGGRQFQNLLLTNARPGREVLEACIKCPSLKIILDTHCILGSACFFHIGSESNYLRLWGPYSLCYKKDLGGAGTTLCCHYSTKHPRHPCTNALGYVLRKLNL